MWPTGVVRHERFLGCVAASDERIEDPHGLCAASVVPASTGSPFPAPEELTVDKRLKGVEPILRVPFFHRQSIGLAGNLCAVEAEAACPWVSSLPTAVGQINLSGRVCIRIYCTQLIAVSRLSCIQRYGMHAFQVGIGY